MVKSQDLDSLPNASLLLVHKLVVCPLSTGVMSFVPCPLLRGYRYGKWVVLFSEVITIIMAACPLFRGFTL